MNYTNTFALTVFLTFGLAGMASAEKINWHGFVAQGAIQADGSNFVNESGNLTAKLTEVGINASYRLNESMRLAGQAIYINGDNRFAEGARVDYLFLDWQLYNSLDTQIHLHLGRNKSYHRLYSATRDVPHTRPSIVLPQSMYIDVFRDVSIGVDGALLRAHLNTRYGEWDFNWNYGHSSISDKQTRLFVSPDANGELDLAREHQGSFYWRIGQHQLGGSFVNATFEYSPADVDPFFEGSTQVKGRYLNYRYSGESWVLTSELARVQFQTTDFLAASLNSRSIAEGGYVQAQYFISPDVTAMARIDMYDNNRNDRSGLKRQQATGNPAYFGYMDMATLGLSWNFAPNWRLQGEVHRVKGTGRLAPILVPDLENNRNKYWDIYAVQVMYWF